MSLKPSVNWLFAFIPVALALEHAEAAPPLVFFAAALAIVPIASRIVHATEQIAVHTGDAIGGLLNATFGNAPELIIAVVALKAGLTAMVLASLVGAILANLLLALGMAFFLGGLRFRDQIYSPAATRMYSSMMLLAVISMSVPAGYQALVAGAPPSDWRQFNLILSGLLLALYVLYLVFMLKTHPDLFASEAGDAAPAPAHGPAPNLPRAIGSLLLASLLAAWMSEILVGAAEGTGAALGMSQAFIGLVFLAIVGGAAESGSAIALARANRMDLSVGIALGSCIQIALFVAPLLVFASYVVAPHPLELNFPRPLVFMLFLAVVVGAMVAGDGRANWFKGVQLITVYALFALLFFYFVPA